MSQTEYSKENKDRNYEFASFYEDDRAAASGNVHFKACELCDSIELDPSLNDMSRLLRAKIKLVNCCPGKELTVGCIVINRRGKILAYKSDTFIARRDNLEMVESDGKVIEDNNSDNCGCSGNCINVVRIFNFILPNSDVCSPLDVNVKVIANYTSPCD